MLTPHSGRKSRKYPEFRLYRERLKGVIGDLRVAAYPLTESPPSSRTGSRPLNTSNTKRHASNKMPHGKHRRSIDDCPRPDLVPPLGVPLSRLNYQQTADRLNGLAS